MKRIIHLLLTVFMVTALTLASVTPALAEDPPPPPSVNPDGSGGTTAGAADEGRASAASTEAAQATLTEPAQDVADGSYASQPNYSPEGAATSGMGAFQGENLVNTGGNPVAAGTDLEALAAGLAYACAPGTLPDFITGGTCHASYAVAQDAVDAASAGWTIWFTAYFDDNADLHVTKSLTLQGNQKGSALLGDIGGANGIYIESSNVTIKDVYSRGAIESTDPLTGTLRLQDIFVDSLFGIGLYIDNFSGSVVLSQFYANLTQKGSYIDVQDGAGTVTIVNSSFQNTVDNWGLGIYAKNAVKLENVNISGNYGDGAYIEYAKGLTIKNGMFSYNADGPLPGDDWGYGLEAYDVGPTYAYPRAPILLQNVSADFNDEFGMLLANAGALTVQNAGFVNNYGYGLYLSGFSTASLDGVVAAGNAGSYGRGVNLILTGAATISSSTFESNFHEGLQVTTAGAVTLKNVKVTSNVTGAVIYTTGAVTVLGGIFTGNSYNGLTIHTHGNVTLNGVVATWNNVSGGTAAVEIDNCDASGDKCWGSGSVTITNTLGQNVISENWKAGLDITSHGNVSINTLFANDNVGPGPGIRIDTCVYDLFTGKCQGAGNVSLITVTANNNGQNYIGGGVPTNVATGIDVRGGGTITLDKVTVQNNTDFGMYLANNETATPKAITVKNIYVLENLFTGAVISSKGAVSVNHINALYNHNDGLSINTGGAVTISNTLGANIVDNNEEGMHINSGSTVTITGLSASNNWNYQGLTIDSVYGPGNVTITNSRFNGNNQWGMRIYAHGNITLTNVQANNSITDNGAILKTSYLAGKTVTVSKGSFNRNGADGMDIFAGGNVTLNGVSASNNAYGGLYITNSYFDSIAAYNVTINSTLGANLFTNNGIVGDGNVYITTSGNITISKAVSNAGYDGSGFQIWFNGTWSGKKITFTCSNADYNDKDGFMIQNAGSNPVSVILAGSGAAGNLVDYYSSGLVTWSFTRTNCP
jgi:hypothetical protein